MGSPAKRRRKNDGTATPSAGARTLDFFFGKTRFEAAVRKLSQAPKVVEEAREVREPVLQVEEEQTDEDLARKLHEEWNGVSSGSNLVVDSTGASAKDRFTVIEEVVSSEVDQKVEISTENKVDADNADNDHSTIPLDQDPLSFDPNSYSDLTKSFPNGRATYALLTRAFVLVTSTRSRIKIVDILVNLLRVIIRHDPGSLLPAVWLATNSIGPSYENNELGLGGSILSKAILKVSGISKQALKALNNKYGDPGDVAFHAKVRQRTLGLRKKMALTICNVYDTLLKIASAKGQGSQDIKQRYVERMLVDAKGEEVRYLTRTLIQHLRIGAVKTTMLIALSRAFLLTCPTGSSFKIHERSDLIMMLKEVRQEIFARAEECLKQCYARRPNYNDIVPVLLDGGLEALREKCGLELHIPLKPMLGSITRDLEEVLVKLKGRLFACEYKYDGQRAQIHCDSKGRVSIFSRHLELMTDKYPDLVALMPQIRSEAVTSFIMEGEVVAVDASTGSLQTFQTLAGRPRKDVTIGAVSVDVCLFAFDLMYLNGEQLLSRPFRERRELLRSMFTEISNKFMWVKSLDTTSHDRKAILDFFKSALDAKCEGIMVKVLDSNVKDGTVAPLDNKSPKQGVKTKRDVDKRKGKEKEKDNIEGGRIKALLATYEPDKRLESWLKVKKDYNTAADSLDLVPIAAWHGSGRKAKWWSPILLAVYNLQTGTFEPVCKCMSGFTDVFYTALKEKYNKETGYNTSAAKPVFYDDVDGLEPDVWFEAQEVWEIKFGDITLSPRYPAARGLVHEDRGLSLRFPRFARKREDKTIEEASSIEFLAGLYEKQMTVTRKEGGGGQVFTEEIEGDGGIEDEEVSNRDGSLGLEG